MLRTLFPDPWLAKYLYKWAMHWTESNGHQHIPQKPGLTCRWTHTSGNQTKGIKFTATLQSASVALVISHAITRIDGNQTPRKRPNPRMSIFAH